MCGKCGCGKEPHNDPEFIKFIDDFLKIELIIEEIAKLFYQRY